MKEITNKRLAVGVPLDASQSYTAFWESFLLLQKPPDFLFIRERGGHASLDRMRNNIVYRAMKDGATHILMMDADQVYPTNTITRLLAHDLDVVSAMVFRRYPPFDPLMFRGRINSHRYIPIDEWEEGDLVKVDATGTGCILYDMKVFHTVKPPWFEFRKNPRKEFRDKDEKEIGEDFSFCSRLKRAGFKIYVDTGLQVSHLALIQIDLKAHLLWRRLKKAQREQEEKLAFSPN